MTVFLIIVAAIVVYAAFKLADDIVEHTAYLRSLEDGSDETPDGDCPQLPTVQRPKGD